MEACTARNWQDPGYETAFLSLPKSTVIQYAIFPLSKGNMIKQKEGRVKKESRKGRKEKSEGGKKLKKEMDTGQKGGKKERKEFQKTERRHQC